MEHSERNRTDGIETARRLIADEREKKIGFLDLGNLRLTEVPVELFELTHLHSLNLGIWYVDEYGKYRESANSDTDAANALHTLPRDFSALGKLAALSLTGNPVSDLGPLRTLTALQSLTCSHTQVSDLSPLRALTALQSLDCSATQVSDLGPLVALATLKRLDASGCRLEDFPRQVLFQENLSHLVLYEATIPGFPAELLSVNEYSSCLEELRNHLIDQDSGVEEVREAKLVVLGNGRVGKTQICRRLRGLPYDEQVPSTHGITVTAKAWAGSAGDEVLNVWDFGGQDIYHGAHTLFMKTSAVFLIVWHPEFETAGEQSMDGMLFRNYPLPYWLEYVRTLGRKDCPVVVVQARCDRPEQEVRRLPADDAFLKFPSLKPCWYSAKTGRGHGALEDALQDAIQYLRERDGIVTIGAGRARVRRQLEAWRTEDQARPTEKRQHRTLSQAEFRSLCEHVGGVHSPESLLAYLHNLGVVFYQPHLFDARIILDQSWALEAVYSVFDRRKAYSLILSQRGRFTQSLLAMTAWREYSHPEQRLFLSLMESCGIAFVHREAEPSMELETEYLAPDMLPGKDAVADQLVGRWNDHEDSWRLEYEYPFLHPGLMRALLCDVGSRSKEAGVYWKYGVWVYEKSTGCRALLEQQMTDERRGRIVLKVQGPGYVLPVSGTGGIRFLCLGRRHCCRRAACEGRG
jgi:internalin A